MSAMRMAFALAMVMIFVRPSFVRRDTFLKFFSVGFVQLGLMYAPYMYSFKYLQAHEVALFTMTSPLFIAAMGQFLRRQVSSVNLVAASLAVCGGVVVAWKNVESSNLLTGFILVQVSNLLFSAGQVMLTQWGGSAKVPFLFVTPFYFLGAFVGSLLCLLSLGTFEMASVMSLTAEDWVVLAWLGVVSTGAGFLLWNFGALKVSLAQLAVAADFKLPIAILVSLVVFGESAHLGRLTAGVLILLFAGWLVRPRPLPKP